MKLYKLTTGDSRTRPGLHNECQWGRGITHRGTGVGGLCSSGYIHAYEHPLLAVLLNPIHADYRYPILWECEGEIAIREGQLKCGCVELTTLRQVELPVVTTEQHIKFAILCAFEVCEKPFFVEWAKKWLSGEDRSEVSVNKTMKQTPELSTNERVWTAKETLNAARMLANGSISSWSSSHSAAMVAEYACKVKEIDLLTIAKEAITL